jgi:two-component system cell cycle response regulator DivK
MKTILLVEDQIMNREMISRRLQMEGYYIIGAGDGASAVLLSKKLRPNLILMDMGLPILNGWQATHRIRTSPETQNIPIIALTALTSEEDRDKCISVGCNAFESKPINFERLLTIIRNML